jgi:hypothetical protein
VFQEPVIVAPGEGLAALAMVTGHPAADISYTREE